MTARPTVQLQSTNLIADLRRHLATVLPTLQALPGVVGITLNGGLARGYGDQRSEIDVTIYLTAPAYAAWQSAQSPIATGITVIDGQLYDVKVLDYAAALAEEWSADACWDGSYAEILHDPEGLIARLFATKTAAPPAPESAGALMMSCWWYFRLAGDIWIHRGDPLQGHHMLNQALLPLVKALFVANGEWIPHDKWLLHMSRTLAWQPPGWIDRLSAALSTGDLSIASLCQRQQVIADLWTALDEYLVQRYWPALPVHVMQRSFYMLLELLNQQGRMSRAAWTAAGGDALFNVDPFHKVVTVDEAWVTLDRQRLLALDPTTVYAWHFAVAAAVRNA